MSLPSAPRGAVGRADLLRALAAAGCERLALDVDGGTWFGYEQRDPPPPDAVAMPVPPPAPVETGAKLRLPLRMAFAHAIVERRVQPRPEAAVPMPTVAGGGIGEDEARGLAATPEVGFKDLVPHARLLPALCRLLGATRPGGLDVDALAQRLAAGNLPRHLPQRCLRRWHPELVVVLDFSPRLWPYRHDMHRLAQWLSRHGGAGVSLRIVRDDPLHPWLDWRLAHRRRPVAVEPRPWRMPAAATPVLLVSDLGLLAGPESEVCRRWRHFAEVLVRARMRPLALAPLGAGQVDASFGGLLPLLRWSPDARTRPAHARGPADPRPAGLDELLALAAVARRIDPPLLRALRGMNSVASGNAGLEGAFWCHADVEAGHSAAVRTSAQDAHLACFAAMPPAVQAALMRTCCRHHRHLRAALNHEEMAFWGAHVGPELAASPEFAPSIEHAGKFMAKLETAMGQPDSPAASSRWRQVAQGIVQRADAAMARHHAETMHRLLAALLRTRAMPLAVPDWANAAKLENLLAEGRSPQACWLVRDAASGWLLLQAQPAGKRQVALGEPFALGAGGARLRVGARNAQWLYCGDLPVPLLRLGEEVSLRLEMGGETITVAPLRRPRGAVGWRCVEGGLEVAGPPLASEAATWPPGRLRAVARPRGGWALAADGALKPTGSAVNFGIDADYGVWAEISIAGAHGSATQRLRWIEAGSFWMGAPEDEAERQEDEGPRHRVTLTRGYWLAESACTQALWQAVMDNNPAHFQDDAQRPVEQVSWDDVQEFLGRLNALLPGCEAGLPTEAEWEYACRAGSETPFAFGAQISPEEVNYNGDYPYAGGVNGLYRQKTVAVKSLPANAWGLYEMHGNVWEWCVDGKRQYTGEAQENPSGPVAGEKGALRALRGGSWNFFAECARSAYRHAFLPGFRYDYLGFRLALRSIEPGPGRPGGPGGVSPRDEAWVASAERSPRRK